MSRMDDIDYRTKVGSKAWDKNHDESVKRASAWRRLHMLLTHDEVTKRASMNNSSARLAEVVREVEKEQKETK